ncbi:hypothetical protein GCM10022384_63990 [Streptomyces marokkonensis]|uniref:Methyltransferase type 11 domain-containing protein n=1 Tax=Streptomyces marokkonensis TaxID=324855 RepID=A0ABP7SC31_9ACTN
MSNPGETRRGGRRPAPPADYWNAPAVVRTFGDAPAPGYLDTLVPVASGGSTLAADIGCGAGRNLSLLARRGYRVVAVDLHEAMLTEARRRRRDDVTYLQADVTRLPFAQASVGFLVCHGVLHNLPSRDAVGAALAELRRVALPSARVSLNVFSSSYLDPALERVGPDTFVLGNGQQMTLLEPGELARLCVRTGWHLADGPHQYLRGGDPGQRSVWRVALEPSCDR